MINRDFVTLSVIAVMFAALLLVNATRGPGPAATVTWRTWNRADAAPGPAEAMPRLEYAEVIARLREIRGKFESLHRGELFEAPDEAAGPAHEIDRLLVHLIADCLVKDPRPEAHP